MSDFIQKGKAHSIKTMASKSCNAVSARELFVPLKATVTVDTAARTFTAVIDAHCYFGTRMNIENTFSDMKINNQAVSDVTINGWVSENMPGKKLGTLTISGDFNPEGKPSIEEMTIPFSGKMTYYSDVKCTKQANIAFSNEIKFTVENIDPEYTQPAIPTIDSITSLDTAFLINASTTSFGEGGGKFLYVEASQAADFSDSIKSAVLDTLSGEFRISNLKRNTKYYVRAVCANNGMISYGATQERLTLAASEIVDLSARPNAQMTVIVYGDPTNNVTTRPYMAADPSGPWSRMQKAGAIGTSLEFDGVGEFAGYGQLSGQDGVAYIKLASENEAGIYESAVYELPLPVQLGGSGKHLSAWIESVAVNNNSARINYSGRIVFPTSVPVSERDVIMSVYYRPAGMEEEWKLAGTKTFRNPPIPSGYFDVRDLEPNYVEYETIVVAMVTIEGEEKEYTSMPKSFYTIPLAVNNKTCDSLEYMVQLICQTYNAIKHGNINIFMNDDTKAWCEGEDGIPTVTTIMSRVNRYMHAVGCVLCSMDGFIDLLKESKPNQVFMGQLGWTDVLPDVVENSLDYVESGGIKDAIDTLISQVWHYVGDYDYYGTDLADLQSQTPTDVDATGVVGDVLYKWDGSDWVVDGTPTCEDFGVIHINKGTHEEKAYYWFTNGWERLDLDTDEIEARLAAIEGLGLVESFDSGNYRLAFASITMTKEQVNNMIPTSATRDTVILLTDPERADETALIVYDNGSGHSSIPPVIPNP